MIRDNQYLLYVIVFIKILDLTTTICGHYLGIPELNPTKYDILIILNIFIIVILFLLAYHIPVNWLYSVEINVFLVCSCIVFTALIMSNIATIFINKLI
jgi:hypothetical protein